MSANRSRDGLKSYARPALVALGVLTGISAAQAQSITEFPLTTAGSGPQGIAAGPDGNLWFTEETGNRIGRITPAGVITEYSLPTADSGPYAIAAGADGNLWFTQRGDNVVGSGNRIGRITPDGGISEFPTSPPDTPLVRPFDMTAGPDGNLWFTTGGKVGRITTTGVVTLFPTSESPFGIAAGPDGSLWFTEYGFGASDELVAKIGRITTTGALTEFPIRNASGSNGYPGRITAGPDGNIWFVEGTNRVGRITMAGVITEFELADTSVPWDIVTGPDANLWLAGRSAIGRLTPAGALSEYPMPRHFPISPRAAGLAVGPDGNLWFSEKSGSRIGRITTTGSACMPDEHNLCLSGGRFLVSATYRNRNGSGAGTAAALSNSSGFFTFGDPDNVELVVKVLDACALSPSNYWVFAAGLTNQETNLTVTDTKTGDRRTYANTLGTTFVTITDTGAFSACP